MAAAYGAFFAARRPGIAAVCGSALIGAPCWCWRPIPPGRLAFAPLQIPAGIVVAPVWAAPFFVILLWRRRDAALTGEGVVCVGSSRCCCC
ncbi:hypothetical protein LNP74_29535 [Klebsiella pneumoniae subsp. pneumoniae]|nr:hypothetical protein [Klebsiella pneumoniae subsp. pneumoniae]